jgi:hyperosmotically inducible protein
MITELTRRESDKDAAISKAVKENFLKDKAVDLTDVNVRTTDGSVELRGTVPSLEAREHAVKLAWRAPGVQSVVNHLEVKK